MCEATLSDFVGQSISTGEQASKHSAGGGRANFESEFDGYTREVYIYGSIYLSINADWR